MTVVPFIPGNSENSTIVEDIKLYKRNRDKVLILDGDKSQLDEFEKGTKSNTSYDLRVGRRYWDVRKNNIGSLEKINMKIKPKMYVEIETEERIRFPIRRAGRISSKVSMLRKGLGVFPTSVDPGYEGYLVIYVCNFGNETVELKRGKPFCALKIETVDGKPNPYDKPSKTPFVKEEEGYYKIVKWIKYNVTVISIVINILMLIATASMAYFAFLKLNPQINMPP